MHIFSIPYSVFHISYFVFSFSTCPKRPSYLKVRVWNFSWRIIYQRHCELLIKNPLERCYIVFFIYTWNFFTRASILWWRSFVRPSLRNFVIIIKQKKFIKKDNFSLKNGINIHVYIDVDAYNIYIRYEYDTLFAIQTDVE